MDIIQQLMRDEGFKKYAYHDTAGHLTIGYGHNLDSRGIPEDIGRALLIADVRDAALEVSQHLPWAATLSTARRGVLVNMCFNMGIGGLLGFRTLLTYMSEGRWGDAATALRDSLYWRGDTHERAERLAKQLVNDEVV